MTEPAAPSPENHGPADGSGPGGDWQVVDFLLRLRADEETGAVQRLGDYLRAYPDREDDVAREYLLVRALDRRTATGPGAGGDGAAADGTGGDARTFGPFRLERELGRGGQGTVHLAIDVESTQPVALKIVRPGPDDDLAEARLRREAAIAARLLHDNLARVVGAGRTDGRLWVAAEYVDGESLAALLAQRVRSGEPFGVGAAAALTAAIARGLHHAHGLGLVHRDVKPGNVIVRRDGTPVLTDFGLLRVHDGPDDRERLDDALTRTGELRGTPAYMAPELLAGASATPRSDVWSLGVVLYECLCLQRPFAGPTVATTAHALLRREVWTQPGYASLPADARAVLAMALAKEPARRYATAADLARDCERLVAGERPLARRPGLVRRAASFARHEPALASAVLAIAALLTMGLLLSLWFLQRERDLGAALQTREARVRTVARSLLGELHSAVRDLPGAVAVRQRMLERARDALVELHESAPDDVEVRRDLVSAWIRLGDVLGHEGVANRGDRDGARRCYEAAGRLAREGMTRGDDACRIQLAVTLVRTGDILVDDAKATRAVYDEALPLLGDADPIERGMRATVQSVLAQHEREAGDLASARARIDEAEALMVADAGDDPARQGDLAGIRLVRATILAVAGDPDAAVALLRSEAQRLDALRELHPHHVQLDVRTGQIAVHLATVLAGADRPEEALAAFDHAVLLRRERTAGDPADKGAVHHLALALAGRARCRLALPRPDVDGAEADLAEAAGCAESAGYPEFAASLQKERAALAR